MANNSVSLDETLARIRKARYPHVRPFANEPPSKFFHKEHFASILIIRNLSKLITTSENLEEVAKLFRDALRVLKPEGARRILPDLMIHGLLCKDLEILDDILLVLSSPGATFYKDSKTLAASFPALHDAVCAFLGYLAQSDLDVERNWVRDAKLIWCE